MLGQGPALIVVSVGNSYGIPPCYGGRIRASTFRGIYPLVN